MANAGVEPARLYSVLTRTGLQTKDPVLYQLLYNLIGTLAKLTSDNVADNNGGGSNSETTLITNIIQILEGGSSGEDGSPGPPGATGATGPQGPAGPSGSGSGGNTFIFESATNEPDFYPPIPGPTGAAGAAGAAGTIGTNGIPGQDGIDGEDGWPPVLQVITPTSATAAARIYRSNAQTFTEDTLAAVTFDTVDFDSNSFWAGGSPTKLTVPTGYSGKYLIAGQISWVIFGGTGDVTIGIYVNGNVKTKTSVNVTGITPCIEIVALLDLVAGDYVEMKATVNEGGTTHNTVGGSAETWLGMALCAGVINTGGTSGALVLLDTKVASSSASLDFTSVITSTYNEYIFEFENVLPATDGTTLSLRVSSNNGSSYDSGNNYRYIYQYAGSNAATGVVNSNSAAQILYAGALENTAASGGANGQLRLYNPLSGVTKFFVGDNGFQSNDGNYYKVHGNYVYNSASVINAVQFYMASGNIASGTIRIYGVKK